MCWWIDMMWLEENMYIHVQSYIHFFSFRLFSSLSSPLVFLSRWTWPNSWFFGVISLRMEVTLMPVRTWRVFSCADEHPGGHSACFGGTVTIFSLICSIWRHKFSSIVSLLPQAASRKPAIAPYYPRIHCLMSWRRIVRWWWTFFISTLALKVLALVFGRAPAPNILNPGK